MSGGAGPRTWRCPAEVVLKGLRGGREGGGLPACERGVGMGRPGLEQGSAGTWRILRVLRTLRDVESPGHPGSSGGQEDPGFWGHRKPHGPCGVWGPSWVPRCLLDIGVHGDAALLRNVQPYLVRLLPTLGVEGSAPFPS